MNTPSPAQGADEIDKILKSYSIVRYDNPNGINTESENDWQQARDEISALIHRERLKGAREAMEEYLIWGWLRDRETGDFIEVSYRSKEEHQAYVFRTYADLTRQLEELESGDAA